MKPVLLRTFMVTSLLLGCGGSEEKSSDTPSSSLMDDWGAVSDTGTDDNLQDDADEDTDSDADDDADAGGDSDAGGDTDAGGDSDADGDSGTGPNANTGDGAGGFGAGESDSVSTEVCALAELESATSVVLASSVDEAPMASVTLGDINELILEMPESGDGYLQVEVPDWMTVVRIFSHSDATYEISVAEEGGERVIAGSCPEEGITDHLWFFHEWGSYIIRIAEGSPAETWLTLYKV